MNPTRQENLDVKKQFLQVNEQKSLLLANALLALVYFITIAFFAPRGNDLLFALLIAGEIFHVWQTIAFCLTMWDPTYRAYSRKSFRPGVDVFITVAGEPLEIIRETVVAAKNMYYPMFNIFILNDGLVAKKENWRDVELLAQELEVDCITRVMPGGAKAGNINHALSLTKQPFVAVFDADHVPHPDFLEKVMGYFIDSDMAIVQAPQFYKNYDLNQITGGAWEQQELFFGPICRGKNKTNSVFMCGTNMVIRRSALLEVGGLDEESITEDFLTSQYMHQLGWKSYYVPEVLAEGLAPEDMASYYKQQLRWARGSLEVIFKHNPFMKRGLSFNQKIQYFTSASFYLSGVVVLIDAMLPLIFFFTGEVALKSSTMTLAAAFLSYIFITVAALITTSNFTLTSRALAFSMSSFVIYIRALGNIVFRRPAKFSVTSKIKANGNFIPLVVPHILYIMFTVVGVGVAADREGMSASLVTNIAWAMFNCAMFTPFILAALPSGFAIRVPRFSKKSVILPNETRPLPQYQSEIVTEIVSDELNK